MADSFVLRLRGLLGRGELDTGDGLLLQPSGSIHTWFMRHPIDAVFLDRDFRVLRTVPAIPPWRVAAVRHARAVLELRAGEAERRGITVGECLVIAA
jgi:uncharacterized membrane protein (UPF0127 family)